ncbi:MAG TPA: KTSC domain-containing protein [Longimicrobiaceae bacterium]|nr:KTSC domain-containing protein [Longimicrobiaceae bacterium]
MTTLPLQLPESLRRKVETFASEEGLSVDEFVTAALVEKLSTLTGDYLENRARRGSRAKYDAALARVPSTEPLPPDRFPGEQLSGHSPGLPEIKAIGYDPEERKVEVEFENGAVCQYFEVPAEVYRRLSRSESPAEFVEEHVRPGPYPFRLAVARSGGNGSGT